MRSRNLKTEDADSEFWQRLILPEEDRRRLHPGMPWMPSYRWFRSANVIDLWRYRSPTEKLQISVRKKVF